MKKYPLLPLLGLAGCLTLGVASQQAVAGPYVYIPIDFPSGTPGSPFFTSVFGINDSGAMAGNYLTADGVTVDGFVRSSGGTFTDRPNSRVWVIRISTTSTHPGQPWETTSQVAGATLAFERSSSGVVTYLPNISPNFYCNCFPKEVIVCRVSVKDGSPKQEGQGCLYWTIRRPKRCSRMLR